MKSTYLLYLLLTLLLGIGLYFFFSSGRWGVEQPSYTLLRKTGEFEIRQYPTLQWVATPINKDTSPPFRRLFKFITGQNSSAKSISMTSPVWMIESSDQSLMAFGLPQSLTSEMIPIPQSPEVRIMEFKGGEFAVYTDNSISINDPMLIEILKGKLATQKITIEGEPLYAFYDPPWVPRWLCRKEVLFRLISR
jgi:SOUL heme-binding protein